MTDARREELTQPDPREDAPAAGGGHAPGPAGSPAEAGGAEPEPTGEPAADAPEGAEREAAPGDGAEQSGARLEELAAADPRSREELLAELFEAEARRDEYLEDVRRARAEFENYRKRVMREGAAQREAGKADALGPLLEVLDDLDRMLEAAQASEDEQLARGVEMVAGKLVHALQGLGLERIDRVGVAFDPNLHEAVQHRQAEEPQEDGPVVADVLRPGYRFGERVLRAAMVVVEE